ncbi:hypothetical protein AZH53_05895 [Methanomicrobiaceae archaeon CYW5]|uniref:PP2C family serine/threonine-protein phosphatase n=1 Tax=Methanovulcanius yangii TaxID=1789227 RepID=UPI0029CA03E9|nr:PP2C family serine/threonine-protein phosphatase [Methanovulcanius yangii]MBT8507941.1 hypothetical protein [Methanovulcanius yangii]
MCGASVAGNGRRKDGGKCQDAWGTLRLPLNAVVIGVADGFGSASRGGTGARRAVDIALERVAGFFHPADDEGDVPAFFEKNRDIVRAGIVSAHEALWSLAGAEGLSPREFACTMILVLWYGSSCTVAHIGDGGVVVRTPDGLICLSSPQKGEYVNETCSLAAADYTENLRVIENVPGTSACALFTDGVERSLLVKNGAAWEPYGPFFSPAFIYLETLSDTTGGGDEIRSFLLSERMQNQSDDDMTLVMGITAEGTCDD